VLGQGQLGELHITISSAAGLKGVDRRSGHPTSDPYVIITCGDFEARTSVLRRTLDPAWSESFVIPGQLDSMISDGLTLEVFDFDPLQTSAELGLDPPTSGCDPPTPPHYHPALLR